MFFHLSRVNGAVLNATMDPACLGYTRFDIAQNERIEFLGDPIFRDPTTGPLSFLGPDGGVLGEKLFDQVPGHYLWFHWRGDDLECGSSFCGLLPLYFRQAGGRLDISSSSFHIARTCALHADDLVYRLERRLFNYALFDRTPWSSIRTVPAHSKLVVDGSGIRVERYFRIEDHFGDGDRGSTADLEVLCDVFESEWDLFIPREGFALSFTGGFDGRTLLGAARKLGRTGFTTYGFGRPGESDIALPERQARALGIVHTPILLDDHYLKDHAFASALAFMELSDHNGNLGRPHYHYAAQRLATDHTYLVTGNFGSELFRALHGPGAMMSTHLINIFGGDDASWREGSIAAAGTGHAQEARVLVDAIDAYLLSAASLTPSQRFYRYVFDELFRKYFGPEIIVQSHFLRNRTPFLSFRSMKALHRTVWAGVHSRLFEQDRSRRLKGQRFYAHYLRRADPELYRMASNKGYAPPDVIEAWRRPLLLAKIAWERMMGAERVDSNSIEAFLRVHGEAIRARFGLNAVAHEDLQALSNRVAWAAADSLG